MRRPMEARKCRGHNRRKGPCGNPAMRGQEVCRIHGGLSPQALNAAQRRMEEASAIESAKRLGLPQEVDPHQALLTELHQSAGIVAWLRAGVDEIIARRGLGTDAAVDTGAWKAWNEQRQHLAKVAEACIRAGIAERTVRIAEAQASLIADVLRRIFEDAELGLSEEQREAARHVARRHLTSIGAA